MKSFLVFKFTCASCSSSNIGKTYHHFKIRIEEHIKSKNIASPIYVNNYTPSQYALTHINLFLLKRTDNSKFNLKIKELYILIGENTWKLKHATIAL